MNALHNAFKATASHIKRYIPIIVPSMVCLLLPSIAQAQATVALAPVAKQQFLSATGVPLAGGCVNTFITGTSTPLATYTDSTGATQNSNPVILDAGGFGNLWLTNSTYRFQVLSAGGVNCATGTLQYTIDGINTFAAVNNATNIFLTANTSDPSGTAGELTYRSDIPCFRGFTTFWDCLVSLTATQTLTNKTLTSPTMTTPTMSNPIINGQPTGNAIQGTDNKLLTSSSIGSAGSPICVDGVGGATTLGCTVPLDADQTGLTANVPATAIGGAITANGFYRFSCLVVDTQAATTSSTLPACSFTFTTADTSQVASQPICASVTTNTLGDSCVQTGIVFMNYFYVKSGSFIKYQTTGYASVGGTPLAYAVHARLEGPF